MESFRGVHGSSGPLERLDPQRNNYSWTKPVKTWSHMSHVILLSNADKVCNANQR